MNSEHMPGAGKVHESAEEMLERSHPPEVQAQRYQEVNE
jgi:hypothetical protein